MYAIFTCRKLVVNSRLNEAQLGMMMLDDQQYALATDRINLKSISSVTRERTANKLAKLYQELSNYDADSAEAKSIENLINKIQEESKAEEERVNRETYAIERKETALENEKKVYETEVTKLEKELEQIEKAEAAGIERANPKYNGLG